MKQNRKEDNATKVNLSNFRRLKRQIAKAQTRCDMATVALCGAVGTPFSTWKHRRGIFCVVDGNLVGKIDEIVVPQDTSQPVCLRIKTFPDVTHAKQKAP